MDPTTPPQSPRLPIPAYDFWHGLGRRNDEPDNWPRRLQHGPVLWILRWVRVFEEDIPEEVQDYIPAYVTEDGQWLWFPSPRWSEGADTLRAQRAEPWEVKSRNGRWIEYDEF